MSCTSCTPMARHPPIRSTSYPYHVTARSNNREWFHISLERFWEILLEILKGLAEASSFRVHALVLMSNHIHLIVTTPEGKLDEGMLYLLREQARRVNGETNRMDHLFG